MHSGESPDSDRHQSSNYAPACGVLASSGTRQLCTTARRTRPTVEHVLTRSGGAAIRQTAAPRCHYGHQMRHLRYVLKQRSSRAATASPACRPMTAASAIRAPNVYSVQLNADERRDGPAALRCRRVARECPPPMQRLLGTGQDDSHRRTRFRPRSARRVAFLCSPPSDCSFCRADAHVRVSTGVQCIKAYCSKEPAGKRVFHAQAHEFILADRILPPF